jgi:hypothetical protein
VVRILVIVGVLAIGVVVLLSASNASDGGAPAASPGPSTPKTGEASSEDYGAAAAGCVPSKTTLALPPGTGAGAPYPGWVGQGGLWALIGQKATIVGIPDGLPPADADPGVSYFLAKPGGAIVQKFPWFRDHRARGDVSVKGQTIPPGPKPLRAQINNDRGPGKHVVPGNLILPRTGCWRVSAKSGSAKLRFVVWVTTASP